MTAIRSSGVAVLGCVVVLATVVASAYASATYNSAEFCNPELCRNNAPFGQSPPKHSACIQRTGPFDYDTCPANTVALEMTPDRQALIVQLHNAFRNRIASGQLDNFEPSDRMVEMKWCDKLAYVAACHAGRCRFEHDQCRNTEEYKNAGQNIASIEQSGGFGDDTPTLEKMVKMWEDEAPNCSMDLVRNFQMLGGPQIGHFTQLAHSRSYRVGCGGVKFHKDGGYTTMLFCNYAETNMLGQSVYEVGETASACQAGRSQRWPGLCSPDEVKFFADSSSPSSSSASGIVSSSSSTSQTRTTHSVSSGPYRSFSTASSSSQASSPPSHQQLTADPFHIGGSPFFGRQQLSADPFESVRRQMQLQTLPLQTLTPASAVRASAPAGSTSEQISTRQTPTGTVTTRTSTDANGVTTTTITESTGFSSSSSTSSSFGDGGISSMNSASNMLGESWPDNSFFFNFFNDNM